MMSKMIRKISPGLVLSAVAMGAFAQETRWGEATYQAGTDQVPSAHTTAGAFAFDFFCTPDEAGAKPLFLSIASPTHLGGRWTDAFGSGGFNGRGLLRAGDMVVGDIPSQGFATNQQVLLTFSPNAYDLSRLLTEQDLSIDFENTDGMSVFDVSVSGAGLGQSLCPIIRTCGHDSANLCSIFTAVEPASTVAIPLEGDSARTAEGQPKWFMSEYQTPFASLPYFKTASIFDDVSGSELHISCLVEKGQALAINFIAGPKGNGENPFGNQNEETAEIVWETGDKAGRWTQFKPFGDGNGLGREGITADLLTRATLEALMTTDQSITFAARQGPAQVTVEFSAAGSRDAICPVMNACDIPLGFSPACASRK